MNEEMNKVIELLNDPAVVDVSDNCPLWATKLAGNLSLGEIRRLTGRLKELEEVVMEEW